MTAKMLTAKEERNTFDFINTSTLKIITRQAAEWEEIFTMHIYNKCLESQYKKNPYNSIRKTMQFLEWSNVLTRNFTKEKVQMTNKYMKLCSK